ncbi:MAG: hypothetical protein MMC33_005097 [Icmadophila ericetorum]|nr:hypothetical protein [Icmadophila ericetorum]
MSYDRKSASSFLTPNDAAVERDRTPGPGGGTGTPLSMLETVLMRLPEGYVVPISGALAGGASGLVSCPLDVIKTKLQAQGGFRAKGGLSVTTSAYHGVSGTARTIWAEEGLRGMYRGLGPMLLGYIPTWAVYLTVYNKAQTYLNTKTENTFLANMGASLAGGSCSTMVTNPIWVIKTRLMSQSTTRATDNHYRPPWHYHNTLDAARKMYRGEGLLSFYSGLTPALLGLTHVAIQFPLYEIFKAKFTGIAPGMSESQQDRNTHFYGLSAAVFLSKVIASTATYPHEVVRTRLQTQPRSPANHYSSSDLHEIKIKPPERNSSAEKLANRLRYRGTIQTCKLILAEEGWRGFYAGLGTNLIRAVPSAMTTILTFEYLKKAMFRHQRNGKAKSELNHGLRSF